ncbi:hypothetical protein SAMN06265182_0140 [Persephonella hydrogeniphila]|uniref:Uncharacterized protein n=1 Tax=Persephonella hydrogeniphila TaxID=198703 RepID=A0A285N144_9AQUI|nr:hypothetical protein [Persephonella hydrogeniphila]SNZ02517.1 hypothetical protein SAMN06265182_0140 [Persephonella hydrogeniphila]
MDKNFPVSKKRTPIQYVLGFLVLILVAVSFLVVLIAVPYLFYLLLMIFFKTLQFGVIFVVLFWLIIVIFLWIGKLIEIMVKNG